MEKILLFLCIGLLVCGEEILGNRVEVARTCSGTFLVWLKGRKTKKIGIFRD